MSQQRLPERPHPAFTPQPCMSGRFPAASEPSTAGRGDGGLPAGSTDMFLPTGKPQPAALRLPAPCGRTMGAGSQLWTTRSPPWLCPPDLAARQRAVRGRVVPQLPAVASIAVPMDVAADSPSARVTRISTSPSFILVTVAVVSSVPRAGHPYRASRTGRICSGYSLESRAMPGGRARGKRGSGPCLRMARATTFSRGTVLVSLVQLSPAGPPAPPWPPQHILQRRSTGGSPAPGPAGCQAEKEII